MGTPALAANAQSPRHTLEPVPPHTPSTRATTHLRSVPHPPPPHPAPTPTTPPTRVERAASVVPVGRVAAPERGLAPVGAPRRRSRIEGTSTDRLSVRACSGEALGRHAQERRRTDLEPATLRLTRRGRLLLTAVSVLVFGAAIVVLGLRVTGVLEPGPRFTHTVPVQVAPGQSLWSIAQSTNPGQDPAIVVEKIADLNNLTTPADLTPGQTLQIPIAG